MICSSRAGARGPQHGDTWGGLSVEIMLPKPLICVSTSQASLSESDGGSVVQARRRFPWWWNSLSGLFLDIQTIPETPRLGGDGLPREPLSHHGATVLLAYLQQ